MILAAGHSRRLGIPKALARVHGESLLRRTARVLAPLASAALLVIVPPKCGRYRRELRGLRVRLCRNPRRGEGLAASVRLGVGGARYAPAALLVPVDLAALSRREIGHLIGCWRASRRRLVARRIDAASPGGGRCGDAAGGTPLILPRRFYAAALALHGDTGLRALVAALGGADRRLIAVPSAAADVDTPEDLARARRRILTGHGAGVWTSR